MRWKSVKIKQKQKLERMSKVKNHKSTNSQVEVSKELQYVTRTDLNQTVIQAQTSMIISYQNSFTKILDDVWDESEKKRKKGSNEKNSSKIPITHSLTQSINQSTKLSLHQSHYESITIDQ